MEYTWLKRDPYWEEENNDPRIDPSEMHLKDCNEDEAEFFRVDAFCEGDYSGSGVQGRANQQALRKEFSDLDGVVYWTEHWPHNTTDFIFSVQVLKDPRYQALKETLEGLEDYPIISEDVLSELESEEEWEAWTNYGADDFRRELRKLASHHDELFDRIYDHEDGLSLLLWVWREVANEPAIHETGGVFFPFDHYIREQRQETWKEIRRAIIDVLHNWQKERKTKLHDA